MEYFPWLNTQLPSYQNCVSQTIMKAWPDTWCYVSSRPWNNSLKFTYLKPTKLYVLISQLWFPTMSIRVVWNTWSPSATISAASFSSWLLVELSATHSLELSISFPVVLGMVLCILFPLGMDICLLQHQIQSDAVLMAYTEFPNMLRFGRERNHNGGRGSLFMFL